MYAAMYAAMYGLSWTYHDAVSLGWGSYKRTRPLRGRGKRCAGSAGDAGPIGGFG